MPLNVAPGFNARLKDAMTANGLRSAQDLAEAVGISLPSATHLMRSSSPVVDAVTLFRICDRTQYSGRWLINATLPTTIRIAADPDEKRLLQYLREIPEERRDAAFDRILGAIHASD